MSVATSESSDPILAGSDLDIAFSLKNERILKKDRAHRSRPPQCGAEVVTNLPDYYDLLGVDRSATHQQVNNAYRYCAKTLYSEAEKSNGAEEREKVLVKLSRLNDAYEVLGNSKSRTIYDYYGPQATRNGFINKSFDFREGLYSRQNKEDPVRFFQNFAHLESGIPKILNDAVYLRNLLKAREEDLIPPAPETEVRKVRVTLEELYNGRVKTVETPGHNTGFVDLVILPGWTHGTHIVHSTPENRSDCRKTAPLVFEINVEDHPNFRLQNFDLHTTISLADAMGVGPVQIRHLDGRMILVNLTELIHPGTAKVLIGEGLAKDAGKMTFGDLHVHFDIIFPEHVDPWQKLELWVALVEYPLPKPPLHYAVTPISQASFEARKPVEIKLPQGYGAAVQGNEMDGTHV
ncbi:dnaJ homolog subfamily B member 4-like isoform X2 [Paramacrobiotus metropolitanus]|uniref:dnaJ homolog subfamily B member 4-like isoform X2 n=1 Tax=Paramacrobiotus metropolitanus TaxID=2943436 RepID=UPI002445D688|nr:dnaJ homolog subfamily B member 4-like isoform X2 [Paramacrobiotus metropolitanus]